jgi:hypothetical protein
MIYLLSKHSTETREGFGCPMSRSWKPDRGSRTIVYSAFYTFRNNDSNSGLGASCVPYPLLMIIPKHEFTSSKRSPPWNRARNSLCLMDSRCFP